MITYRYRSEGNLDQGVVMITDGVISFIPNCDGNYDWQIFQAWLALGNTPEAA